MARHRNDRINVIQCELVFYAEWSLWQVINSDATSSTLQRMAEQQRNNRANISVNCSTCNSNQYLHWFSSGIFRFGINFSFSPAIEQCRDGRESRSMWLMHSSALFLLRQGCSRLAIQWSMRRCAKLKMMTKTATKKKKKMVKARRAQIANAILIGHRARFHFIQTRLWLMMREKCSKSLHHGHFVSSADPS